MLDSKQIDSLMTDYINRKEIAGAGIIIRKEDEKVFESYYGYADIENGVRADENTIYRLASMTKPIVALAVMMLVDEGKIKLDDLLSEYLPSFSRMRVLQNDGSFVGYQPNKDNPTAPLFKEDIPSDLNFSPASNQITIKHLLNHSSGLGQGPLSTLLVDKYIKKEHSLEERVQIFSELPLDFEPGTQTGYSALVAYDILGYVIEKVSGQSLNDFLRDRLFKPLGILNLGYDVSENNHSHLAKLYESNNGTLTDVSETEKLWTLVNPLRSGYCSGSAGMLGTIEDYDKIAQLFLNKGVYNGARLLSKDSYLSMTSKELNAPLELIPGVIWGLGVIISGQEKETHKMLSEGTYGWSGAYGTHFFVDPLKKISVVLGVNCSNIGGAASPLSLALEEIVYQYC
ncbi:serine hydrolase domain-containing protein [uncultured Trichococcus sp.]|uniref:serine hydrolase domain-containing protein n=1 Tax=uncultured Trichococcus sp. TaxID=189665 RepID=UPI002A189ECC|nr:serine hydrolase domain-containing protein [uncultured Trichococcus sp.]